MSDQVVAEQQVSDSLVLEVAARTRQVSEKQGLVWHMVQAMTPAQGHPVRVSRVLRLCLLAVMSECFCDTNKQKHTLIHSKNRKSDRHHITAKNFIHAKFIVIQR